MKNTVKKVITSAITLVLAGTMAISAMAGASAKTTAKKTKKHFELSLTQLEKRAKIYYTTTEPAVGVNKLTFKAKSISSNKAVVKIYTTFNGKTSVSEKYTVKKTNGIGKSASGEKVDLGNPNPYALKSSTYISSNSKHYDYMTINNLKNEVWFWNPHVSGHTTAKFTFKNNTYTFNFGQGAIYTAKLSDLDECSGKLVFSEGHLPSHYTLVSTLTSKFSFYTDAQLTKMAKKCFKSNNDSSGNITIGVDSAKYGCATIEIRRSVNGISSLCERYTINRIGGTGFDTAGNKVDLNRFA